MGNTAPIAHASPLGHVVGVGVPKHWGCWHDVETAGGPRLTNNDTRNNDEAFFKTGGPQPGWSVVHSFTTGQDRQHRTGQDDRTTPTASRDTNQYAQYTHNSRLRRQDSGRIEYTQKTTGRHDNTTPRQNIKLQTALPFTELGFFK